MTKWVWSKEAKEKKKKKKKKPSWRFFPGNYAKDNVA